MNTVVDIGELLGPLGLCLGIVVVAAVLYFIVTLIKGDGSDRRGGSRG